nr:Rieske (2Fe-2S) protein [Acidiferrobacterales bacterium]
MSKSLKATRETEKWQFASTVEKIQSKSSLKTRVSGRQIALFQTSQGIRACDNRCPHEGYPLSEGTVSEDCTLTCNWHNWKFNLETGENLFGGDKLNTYPVEIRGNEIWVDMQEPPYETQYANIVNNLKYAFDHESYDQIARECARLKLIGGDPMDTLRLAIEWSWQKLEFGWTHAYAGMADWLLLYDEFASDAEMQLTCLLESISHTSFDVLRERTYPYTNLVQRFDTAGFLQAIESEDENTAVAMVAGGLQDGLHFSDFEQALTEAALAHYNDFGHSLIYVTKIGFLIDRLGNQVERPLLLSLVRSFIYSAREDQ